MIPNFFIPSEYEMLQALSKNSGVAIVWNCNAKGFIEDKKLQIVWESKKMPSTEVFLLSGKNDILADSFQVILKELQKALE